MRDGIHCLDFTLTQKCAEKCINTGHTWFVNWNTVNPNDSRARWDENSVEVEFVKEGGLTYFKIFAMKRNYLSHANRRVSNKYSAHGGEAWIVRRA